MELRLCQLTKKRHFQKNSILYVRLLLKITAICLKEKLSCQVKFFSEMSTYKAAKNYDRIQYTSQSSFGKVHETS